MKKTLLVALAVLGVGVTTSKADVAFSVSFGNRYTPQHCAPVYRAPVCVTPAPVYVAPAPVYRVYPQPVYQPVYPQPVYAPVCPTPVVVQPRYYGGYSHGYSRHHSGYNPGYSHHRSSYGHHGYSRNSVRIGW